MRAEPTARPVRFLQGLHPLAYGAGQFVLFGLFFFYPAAKTGLGYLVIPLTIAALLSLAALIEARYPNNRLHLAIYSPVFLGGPIMILAAVLTLLAAGKLNGPGLWLVVLGVLYVALSNAYVIRHMDKSAMIDEMQARKLFRQKDQELYFALPFSIGKAAGLPAGGYKAILLARWAIIAMIFAGAVIYGPGAYSSVNTEPRLVQLAQTMMLGFGILFSRLWQLPLAIAVQRRFESPAETAFPDQFGERPI